MKNRIAQAHRKIKNDSFWGPLAKNSVWAFVGDALSSGIGLIITIVLVRVLGADNYGVFVLGQTYMIIMDIIVNVQSWKGVIQYGQDALAKHDLASFGGYVRTGAVLDLSTAALCGVLSILLAPIVGGVLGWSNELVACAQIFSLVIFSHFAGTPTAVLRLADKFNLVAWQKFLSALLKLGAFIVIMVAGPELSLQMAVIVYVVAETLGNVSLTVFAVLVYRKKFAFKYIFDRRKKIKTKEFVRFTLWGTLIEIFDLPVNYLDVFIVSIIGMDYVAIYKVFKQIVNLFQKVTSSVQQAIMPQLSDLYARGKKKVGYAMVIKIRNITLAVGIPLAILIGLTSPFWLEWFYGDLYAGEWGYLLAFLIIQILALSYASIHPYFLSLGRSKQAALYTLMTNIIYMVVAFLSIKWIGFGAMMIAFFVQSSTNIFLKVKTIRKDLTDEEKK